MALVDWDSDPVNANSFVSAADADAYFTDAIHAADWTAANSTTKDQALVTATRILDRQQWKGTKVSTSQPLTWPRDGVTDREGNAVANNDIPIQIREATYELGLALIQDLAVQTKPNTFNDIRSVQAGTARVEFAITRRDITRFPQIIQELVSQFLSASGSSLVGLASGTDETSTFETDGYGLSRGFP